MSALINVGYAVNTSQYFSAMDAMADKSDSAMERAGAAADRWQSRTDAAAERAAGSVGAFGNRFDAANDEILKSAERSASAVEQIDRALQQVDLQSWSYKVSRDMGRAFQEGTSQAQSWTESLVSWVESKLILAGVAIAAGVSVAALSAVYAAYKIVGGTMEFVKGLFTGDSYKSDNVDALIATNQEVMKLQDGLGIAAAKASAFNEALKNLGVDQDAYLGTTEKGNKAIHDNTDELDRLGVKYKDAAGHLRPLIDVQRSALEVIQQYKTGWDRHEAAAAIGMGSEKELQDAVSVTQEKVGAALDRLAAYNLVIGDDTQAAVSNYERAMRQFQRETDLTSQGFKRAIADNIMPTLADMADFFQDGFPTAVRGFRVAIASVTFLMLGLKTTAYTVSEGVLESFKLMGDIVVRVGTALQQAMSGHFDMAVKTMMNAPDDLNVRWNSFMMNVRTQMTHNRQAFDLAWGSDSTNAKAQITQHDVANNASRTWKPKPRKVPPERVPTPIRVTLAEDSTGKQLLEAQLKALERDIQDENTLLSNREQMLKTYYDRGQISASEYYGRLDQLRTDNIEAVRADYATEIALIEQYGISAETQKQAIDATSKLAEAQDKLERAIQGNGFARAKSFIDQDSRSAQAGFDRAVGGYVNSAQDAGKQIEGAFSNAFSGMEDAMARFVTTGKLNFSSLTNSILSDLARIAVRQSITAPLASAIQGLFSSSTESGGGYFQGLSLSGQRASGGPVDAGGLYLVGEQGPELLKLGSQSGAITPNAALGGSAGRGVVVNIVESPGNGGQVQQSQGPGGVDVLTVLVDRVKGAVAGDIAKSGGIAKVMEQRYGLSPAMGAVR